MEDRIRDLEDKVRKHKRSMSPTTIVQHASEAAKIDNETLREQVTHLDRKVNQLETQLEYARDNADKEEQVMRGRIAKYKDNEALLRHELLEARSEVENRKRVEATGKARIEEVEEALRENIVALENARAEIENLRTELAVCMILFIFFSLIPSFCYRTWKECKPVSRPRARLTMKVSDMRQTKLALKKSTN